MKEKENEKNDQMKSTTILLNAEQRELVLRAKEAMEERVKRTSGVEIKIPMRDVVVMCVKDRLAAIINEKEAMKGNPYEKGKHSQD